MLTKGWRGDFKSASSVGWHTLNVLGRNVLHVDVDVASGFIYWCDFSSSVRSSNGIRRIKPDGSTFSNIVTYGIGTNGIRGIAVDWVAGMWTVVFITVSEVVFLDAVWAHLRLGCALTKWKRRCSSWQINYGWIISFSSIFMQLSRKY